jgi:Protein of unknown function (DUF2934)
LADQFKVTQARMMIEASGGDLSSTDPRNPGEPEHDAIALRALHLSCLPNAGSDDANWGRARLELIEERKMIAERATEIARSEKAGSDDQNWLRAEQELEMSFRAKWVYRTKVAYFEGGRRADSIKRERVALRAKEIAARDATRSKDSLREAERLIDAEFAMIAQRASSAFAGTPRWLAAERELIEEGLLPLRGADGA